MCRQLPSTPAKQIAAFLREWAELVDGCDDPLLFRQRELVTSVLDRCALAAAHLVAA